jgi:hypothetical protein
VSLKGCPIPTNGVVIFNDIGGKLGPAEGLICSTTYSQYWSFPNGTHITNLPNYDVFGSNYSKSINRGESLYYGGIPKERGKFQCTITYGNFLIAKIPVYIVDMNVTGPNLTWPGEIIITGEDVALSMNVTTFPEDIPVPYQWSVNGTNLLTKDLTKRYQGIQTDTLTISNVQVEDQGSYNCSVASSASGININSIKIVVGKLLYM